MNDIFKALCQAQKDIKHATKDADNPFFKSHYATLASTWDACREALTKNDLCVVQTTEVRPDGLVVLITTLGHSSGQSIRGEYPINPVKSDPQGYGSAVTYARRYALSAMVGVAQADDDGNSASAHQPAIRKNVPDEEMIKHLANKAAPQRPPNRAPVFPPPANDAPLPEDQDAFMSAPEPQFPPYQGHSAGKVSDKQVKRLWAIAKDKKWTGAMVSSVLRLRFNVNDPADLDYKQYNSVIDVIQNEQPQDELPF